jgi:hypothetical protein
MSSPNIPTDNVRVDEATITDQEWADAANAHERFKALVATRPRAKVVSARRKRLLDSQMPEAAADACGTTADALATELLEGHVPGDAPKTRRAPASPGSVPAMVAPAIASTSFSPRASARADAG